MDLNRKEFKNLKTIKVFPDYRYDRKRRRVPKNIRAKADRDFNWWYLHGELEDEVGYDKGEMWDVPIELKKESANWMSIMGYKGESNGKILVPHLDGIFRVKIYGDKRKCIGFFWTSCEYTIHFTDRKTKEKFDAPIWENRGLIVYEDDDIYIEDAYKKYKQRKTTI